MALSQQAAVDLAAKLMQKREAEKARLELLLSYRQDGASRESVLANDRLAGLPSGIPDEVKRLAKASRVNLIRYVVSARVQAMFIDGFQTAESPENVPGWTIWQRNGFDARQLGVHRAALTFGAGFVVVTPGEPSPVMRGVSPRSMTVGYGNDTDWPLAALEKRRDGSWRLVDETSIYAMKGEDGGALELVELAPHGATYAGQAVCPVIRFRDTDDLDIDVSGIVEPFRLLQDQINITTFGLQVAQHYGAFRQRYILGWLAESEAEALKTGASRLMMFEDAPGDVEVGEFAQTDLRGYIESREATIRHLATVSQTPVHELLGQFINLSAEALEAARASHQAAIDENRIVMGEAWEQSLNLASEMAGETVDPSASVIWRDTRIRSLSDAATGLGALVTGLGVPPRALWPRIPGVAQHELEQWRAMADEGDAFADLEKLLDRQANPQPTPPAPA
ncbi:MAG: phage portal protein [Solirubrobacterales bacterium]|nr:phage portal protein [Solirubrobacterales bacterium]